MGLWMILTGMKIWTYMLQTIPIKQDEESSQRSVNSWIKRTRLLSRWCRSKRPDYWGRLDHQQTKVGMGVVRVLKDVK